MPPETAFSVYIVKRGFPLVPIVRAGNQSKRRYGRQVQEALPILGFDRR
jgi:hypothetical protein